MAKISKDDVLSYLETSNMLEISELIKNIEEKFDVSAAAPVAVATAPGGSQPGEAQIEEQSEFNVELSAVGEKKINVIKVIREITALGLKEAKELADGALSVVKESVAKEEAEQVKAKLEEAGATVTLK